MDFNEELQKLRKAKKQCISEIKSIEDEKQTELEQIDEAKKQVILKYAELSKAKYQELNIQNSKIDAYCKLIVSHSYFNAKSIGMLLLV